MKTTLSVIAFLLIITVSSCKKEGASSSCTLSATSLAGVYKITALKITSGSSTTDSYDIMPACEKNAVYYLEEGGAFSYVEGSSCAYSHTDVWSLSGNQLTMDGSDYTITNFSCDNFIATITIGAFVYTYTYTRQDDSNPPVICTLSDAALAGKYKISTVKYKVNSSTPEVDGKSILFESCQLDDTYTFKANHSLEYADAGTICEPNGSYTSTWSLAGNILNLDGSNLKVEAFSCNSLTISQTDIFNEGDKGTVTFTRQ